MIDALFQGLNAAGNIAIIFAAFGLWRLDRRVVRIETFIFGSEGMRE